MTITEAEFAAKLGVAREAVRVFRETRLDPDDYTGHRPIKLTESGQKKVAGFFGLPDHPDWHKGTSPTPGMIFSLIVTAIPRNPRLLLADHPGNAGYSGILRVRVRDNRNFTPGMTIRARMESDTMFALVGRCPRWKGRY